MMYAQKEARAARQFRAVAIFATIVFHLSLFAAIGYGMFGEKDREQEVRVPAKQEVKAERTLTGNARP